MTQTYTSPRDRPIYLEIAHHTNEIVCRVCGQRDHLAVDDNEAMVETVEFAKRHKACRENTDVAS